MPLHEVQRRGLDAVETVTTLLQRRRAGHPTAGLYEAADLQWWWAQRPRTTDDLPQLFWLDESGHPEAAILATETGSSTQLDPFVLPEAPRDLLAEVIARGLTQAAEAGIGTVQTEVAHGDDDLRDVLATHGFAVTETGLVEAWLAADDRPAVTTLAGGYDLSSRAETADRPHHMLRVGRGHPDTETRLRQVSLYRPELDLVVHDAGGEVAAYVLFWYDPASATGLVEPVRTQDAHQGRGLARALLTAGIDRLVRAGAGRIKICFEPDNGPAAHLYQSVGFLPDRQTDIYSGPTGAGGAAPR